MCICILTFKLNTMNYNIIMQEISYVIEIENDYKSRIGNDTCNIIKYT